MKYLLSIEITGRGKILIMELEEGETIRLGDRIPHDGRLLTVTGIETSPLLMYPPFKSKEVGLLVREEKEEVKE